MTEAVPLGELLHEEALFGLTGVRQVGVPRGRLFPSGLCISANTSSSLGVARPFTNKVEKGWKKCTDPMVGGATSITLYDVTEVLRSDHRRRKRLHGSGCTTAKAVLEELMSTIKCTYPTLQDGNALLCHSCELRLTNIRKAETKISDMIGIVRDQLATLCNPEKRSIAAECDPPVPQAKRMKLTGKVEQRDTAGGGASSPQLELGNEDRLKAQLLWSCCINTYGSPQGRI